MTKTDNRHYNRTEKRMLSIEMDYWVWFHNKETRYGIISDVRYIGNTFYGNVKVKVNEKWYLVGKKDRAYRPCKTDLDKLMPTSEPQ